MTIVAYQSHKIIVMYNTKCAQTALYNVFGMPWNIQAGGYFHSPVTKGEASLNFFIKNFPRHFVTAWVRNPYARMVSFYKFSVLRPKARRYRNQIDPFNVWLRMQGNKFYATLSPLSYYLGNHFDKINFIGRQENFDNDVKFIADKYNIPYKKPRRKNASQDHPLHWEEFYDDETKAIVSKMFKTDIELFYPDFKFRTENP